jgi:hypothetical protein
VCYVCEINTGVGFPPFCICGTGQVTQQVVDEDCTSNSLKDKELPLEKWFVGAPVLTATLRFERERVATRRLL